MPDNHFRFELNDRDYQRVGAALAALVHRDARGIADVLKDATEAKRGFHYHVAVLQTLAHRMGLDGPDGDEVLANLQQEIAELARRAEAGGDD